jgi:hypothetical protein
MSDETKVCDECRFLGRVTPAARGDTLCAECRADAPTTCTEAINDNPADYPPRAHAPERPVSARAEWTAVLATGERVSVVAARLPDGDDWAITVGETTLPHAVEGDVVMADYAAWHATVERHGVIVEWLPAGAPTRGELVAIAAAARAYRAAEAHALAAATSHDGELWDATSRMVTAGEALDAALGKVA